MTTEARDAVLGPATRWLWRAVYASTTALTASALYLGAVSFMEWLRGDVLQGYVYQWALLVHLGDADRVVARVPVEVRALAKDVTAPTAQPAPQG